MWLFGPRKPKSTAAPEVSAQPQVVRRTEIIVEREWTSTLVRKPLDAQGPVLEARDIRPVDGDKR